MAEFTVGQSGIQFGGGQFSWGQLPTGQWGWTSPDGRKWDALGNPVTTGGQPPPAQQPSGLGQQQMQANSLLEFLRRTPPNKVNAFSFNRLPTSTKQLTLAGYEALGYDPGDVEEQIQKLIPRHAAGPTRGYVAPMGR